MTRARACDEGDLDPGDGCTAACQLELLGATCGDGTVDMGELCDDNNLANGDECNPTCNLGNATSLFVGGPGILGLADGVGMDARISGTGGLAVDLDYLYLADAQNNCIRRIEIATATVETIAGSDVGMEGYVDDPDGLNARFAGLDAIATDGKSPVGQRRHEHRLRAVSPTARRSPSPPSPAAARAASTTASATPPASTTTAASPTTPVSSTWSTPAPRVRAPLRPATQEVVTLAGTAYMNDTIDGVGAESPLRQPALHDLRQQRHALHRRHQRLPHPQLQQRHQLRRHLRRRRHGRLHRRHRHRRLGPPPARPHPPNGTSLYFAEFNQNTIRQGILATQEVSTNAGQHCDGNMMCPGSYVEGVGLAARFNGPFALAFHPASDSRSCSTAPTGSSAACNDGLPRGVAPPAAPRTLGVPPANRRITCRHAMDRRRRELRSARRERLASSETIASGSAPTWRRTGTGPNPRAGRSPTWESTSTNRLSIINHQKTKAPVAGPAIRRTSGRCQKAVVGKRPSR